MSSSSLTPSPTSPPEADLDDPLCITESDRRQFKATEAAIKRKLVTPDGSEGSIKKPKVQDDDDEEKQDLINATITTSISIKTEENGIEKIKEESESVEVAKIKVKDEICSELDVKEETEEDEEVKSAIIENFKDDFELSEKLKEMSEISVKPISKNEKEQMEKQNEDACDKVSIDVSKKDKKEQERKVQNLRKNIKDVLDDTQLDATTLAAQRQESERLARVQEQQRQIRETQRQIVAEKQANKTQQRVLSLLQGESNDPPSSAIDLNDPILEKFTLSSSINITPAAKAALQSIQSLISTDDQIPDSDETDDDDDDDVIIQPDESLDKSKAVVVDSSSDSDDCIILSDEEDDAEEEDENNSGEHTNDVYNQRDAEGRVVINVGHGEHESNIYVAPQIARIIKPHQIGGVRFLFDNIIESLELFDKSTGFGCILAHSMGLGKTLQLVCFCDIFLRHTSSKSILIIMPINTLQNWLHEFNMWLPLPEDAEKSPLNKDGEVRPRKFNIFVLNDSHKTLNSRAKTILEWSKEGGVLMMGYEIYRLLSLKKIKTKKKKGALFNSDNDGPSSEDQDLFDKIHAALVNPGPDLVVCDEGHRIKNAHASTSLALKQIKSKRRIVLTGYPLQNNLLEYWCMVDFVRPSYLGTKTEFSNMFERPIQNGQCIDSTPQDCKLMRYRAHVLHSLLKGFVQRRSHTVLQKCLPVKTEFVLLVRMTPFQRKLYTVFMDEVVRSKKVPNPLKAFSVCCKIWNHPDVLYNFLKKRELDLDLELEEETIGKANEQSGAGNKKRGRKTKEPSKAAKKVETKLPQKSDKVDAKVENIVESPLPIKAESLDISNNSASKSDSFKAAMTPSSNDSAYSSNQSITSTSYDSSYNNSYSGYPNYDNNSYQNYNYNNSSSGNGYQNWNNGNYWQSNYAQNDYSQGYYQTNSYQNSYYGHPNYQPFDQKPPLTLPKVEAPEVTANLETDKKIKPDGGLLADVIKEETKEQLEKDSKQVKDEADIKDSCVTKNSRDDGIPYDWALDLMKDYVSDLMENSPKMEIFFCILEESIKLDDRLLVFSQSLLTLNLLEKFLQRSKIPNTDMHWAKNVSYFRLDGSTAALEREKLINEFNINPKVKLFLVSTRAGSLGINLVGANRVIVFDASWNPCHDTQAVCRVYRYGQSKSCYVYRFVMDNCLEKKIYDRQINKQGMADRVVDECNPDAHLSMREVTSLCYDDGDDPELKDFSSEMGKYEDLVARKILEFHSKALTKEPFQHESLLVDRIEKKLSVAEKRLAQRGYEMEKQAASKPSFNYNSVGTNYRAFRTPEGIVHRPVASVRPMQNELGDAINSIRANNPKPNRWVPVEVWQSKGLTAQEMTLPQDVSIQTNSADKSKIYLKAGQKVIVLKSPKGICLQLESGKVIAIRASMKSGQQAPGVEQKLGNFAGLQDNSPSTSSANLPKLPPRSDNDVIDISNDDDDDDGNIASKVIPSLPGPIPVKPLSLLNPSELSNGASASKVLELPDEIYKEKVVYKPNLIQRKPKMPPPPVPAQDFHPVKPFESGAFQGLQKTANKWDNQKSVPHSQSNYFNRNVNGASNYPTTSRIPPDEPRKVEHQRDQQRVDSSAFHPPTGAANLSNASYISQPYSSQNIYQDPSYSNINFTPPPSHNTYNYPYQHSYSNAPPNYQYPPGPANFDPNFQSYQPYHQLPPTNSYPPPINPDPTGSMQVPFTAPSNWTDNQWSYNN